MSIEFYCECGKRLRARDKMAGRRTMCPSCGCPVGIPGFEPTHRGTHGGTLSLQRPRRRSTPHPAESPSPSGPGPREAFFPAAAPAKPSTAVRLVIARERKSPSWRKPTKPEQHWYQCLLYPLRAGGALPGLSLICAAAVGGWLLFLPMVRQSAVAAWHIHFVFVLASALAVLAPGYALHFLGQVLRTSSRGSVKTVCWEGLDPAAALRALGRWAACLLAGPLFATLGAGCYWMQCGDLSILDWLIILEICLPALGYFLLALVTLHTEGELRQLWPGQILLIGGRLGHGIVLLTCCTAAASGVFAWLGVLAAEQVHLNPFLGFVLLYGLFLAAMYLITFAFRLLGLWYYRAPKHFDRIPLWALPGRSVADGRVGFD